MGEASHIELRRASDYMRFFAQTNALLSLDTCYKRVVVERSFVHSFGTRWHHLSRFTYATNSLCLILPVFTALSSLCICNEVISPNHFITNVQLIM
jgi:hypothetical protein